MLTTKTKVIASIATVVVLAAAATWTVSSLRLRSMERVVEAAKARAQTSEQMAAAAEKRAAAFEEKIAYLESSIADIGEIARRQDEDIRKATTDSDNARRDVERTRNVRTVGRSSAELCEKLASLGHPC